MTVTPVRTGPVPTTNFPLPLMRVVWPTSTPRTSVIASNVPGAPSKGTPRSRARGFVCANAALEKTKRTTSARMSAYFARSMTISMNDPGTTGGRRLGFVAVDSAGGGPNFAATTYRRCVAGSSPMLRPLGAVYTVSTTWNVLGVSS